MSHPGPGPVQIGADDRGEHGRRVTGHVGVDVGHHSTAFSRVRKSPSASSSTPCTRSTMVLSRVAAARLTWLSWPTPVASASIAQVHFATIRNAKGRVRDVAVKVLRPGMRRVMEKDLALMAMMAGWVESLSADGKRLKPREVVAEFNKYLHDELDLVREAANAAQLRRNMAELELVLIPEMIWDFCHPEVMVMERMNGVPIGQLERLGPGVFRHPVQVLDRVAVRLQQVRHELVHACLGGWREVLGDVQFAHGLTQGAVDQPDAALPAFAQLRRPGEHGPVEREVLVHEGLRQVRGAGGDHVPAGPGLPRVQQVVGE